MKYYIDVPFRQVYVDWGVAERNGVEYIVQLRNIEGYKGSIYVEEHANSLEDLAKALRHRLESNSCGTNFSNHKELVRFCKRVGVSLSNGGAIFSWYKENYLPSSLIISIVLEMPWEELSWEELEAQQQELDTEPTYFSN